MRDSLNSGERPSRQKRITLSEMPNLQTQKINKVVRISSRGSAMVPARRKPVNILDDHPLRASRKRSRAVVQMGTTSSCLQRKDPSISPGPSRKRGRPMNEERLRPDKQDAPRSSVPSRRVHSASTTSRSCRISSRSHVSSGRVGSPTRFSGRTTASSSSPPSSPTATTIDTELFDSIQHQGPQRQTRKRPIDHEKLMKIIIGEGRHEGVNCSSIDSAVRCRQPSLQPASAASTATSVDDEKDPMETLKAFSPGRVSVSPCRNGHPRTSSGSARRFAARSSSTRSRARGTAASPGRRGTATSNSGAASSPQATGAGNGNLLAAAGGLPETERASGSGSKETVIVPCFRLHNLFGTAAGDDGDTLTQSGGDGNAGSGSSSTGSPGGALNNPLSSIGARRKRPVGKATTKPGAGSMAPPHPHTCPPRGELTVGAGNTFQGFLDVTKDALVRSTHTIFGSDYDMDDGDEKFLETLNSGDGAGGDPNEINGAVAEEDWGISKDLFEAMIERLERQESRARDTQVLAEESNRLREDHDDAAERVSTLKREADSVCFAGNSNNAAADAGAGSRCHPGDGPGDDDNYNNTENGGNGKHDSSNSNGANRRKRREKKGYVYEEDSDSDVGECQARIMRGRGPVILSAEFALPLLRTCIAKHQKLVGGGCYHGVSNSSAEGGGGVGGASRCKRGKTSRTESGGKMTEVSDSKLLLVFRYWARKRERYGGPMLRCFHAFIMKLWRRMEDPQREAEDLEEGKDPHASPEAFQTLKSFRQDLDKARLVVDCVKRREKLKRSAIRHANSLWKIVDETQDAPRIFRAPSTPPSLASPMSWSSPCASSSDPKLFPAGYGGPSTRGSSVRLAKAKATLATVATSEALQEEEHEENNEETVEETHRRRRQWQRRQQQEEVAGAARGGIGLSGARVKPNRTGCAEQEQAWNALARLPARWSGYYGIGSLNLGELEEEGEHMGGARAGGMITRGQKRREGGKKISGSRVSRARGLFVLCPGFVKGGDISPGDAAGGNGGRKLRAGVVGLQIPSHSVTAVTLGEAVVEEEQNGQANGKTSDQQQEQNPVHNTRTKKPPLVTVANLSLDHEKGRASKVDALGVVPSLLQQRQRASSLPPLTPTIPETRGLRQSTRIGRGKRAGIPEDVEAGEVKDVGSAILHNDGRGVGRPGLRGGRSNRGERVSIGAPAMGSAATAVTPEAGEDDPCSAVGMTTRARRSCGSSTPSLNPPPPLSNSRKASTSRESKRHEEAGGDYCDAVEGRAGASGEVESVEENRMTKRSKMVQTKAGRPESEGGKGDVLGAVEVDGGFSSNGYGLRSRGRNAAPKNNGIKRLSAGPQGRSEYALSLKRLS